MLFIELLKVNCFFAFDKETFGATDFVKNDSLCARQFYGEWQGEKNCWNLDLLRGRAVLHWLEHGRVTYKSTLEFQIIFEFWGISFATCNFDAVNSDFDNIVEFMCWLWNDSRCAVSHDHHGLDFSRHHNAMRFSILVNGPIAFEDTSFMWRWIGRDFLPSTFWWIRRVPVAAKTFWLTVCIFFVGTTAVIVGPFLVDVTAGSHTDLLRSSF